MKKTKIFLDTSVISHLDHPDKPDWTIETNRLWNDLINCEYEIVISDAVIEEISRCRDPKILFLFEMLGKIEFIKLEINDSIEKIADEIISLGVLTKKHRYDSLHIASAIYSQCKYLVSWNFDDLVNVTTNEGIKGVSFLKNYPQIEIVSPYNLRKKEES